MKRERSVRERRSTRRMLLEDDKPFLLRFEVGSDAVLEAQVLDLSKAGLRIVVPENYCVELAEFIIPASDLSQQISTAGMEASGTGNMKLALNGALTIGTRDGATIEIGQEVGEENVFFFGMGLDQVAQLRNGGGYDPWAVYNQQPELRQALDMVRDGYFSQGEPDLFRPIFDSLTAGGDYFMVLADFAAYLQCLDGVDAVYRDPSEWTRRAIVNVAKMGSFTSDRMVREYADEIWKVKPLKGRKRG